MKHLYIFNIVYFLFIANYHVCRNEEVFHIGRKLEKLRKIEGLLEKTKDEKEQINVLDKLSHADTSDESEQIKLSNTTSGEGEKIKDKLSNKETSDERTSNNSIFSNSQWPKQWYLHKDHVPAMGVYEAWEMGYTGKGVVIALVGGGVDINHYDLVDNFNASLSYDFVGNTYDVTYRRPDDTEVTRAAGVVCAAKNGQCVTGVAYDASCAVFRAYTPAAGVTNAWLNKIWTYKMNDIDIISHGFGMGIGHGSGFYPLAELPRKALQRSIKEGRHGKGSIVIFGATNDGKNHDDCNHSEFVNSIYTIGVTSLSSDGGPATYAEECTCVLVGVYAGEKYPNGTRTYPVTTGVNNTCDTDYGGAAGAASLTSGIIALVLQANPELTWRDVQHLLLETAITTGIPRGNFYVNAAGRNVSYSTGFGMINAKGLVEKAVTWKRVPNVVTCRSGNILVDKCCTRNVSSSYFVDDCHIQYLEHVQIYISYEVYWREHTEIHIVSPQETDARILRQRKQDYSTDPVAYTFMSVHTWGESPTGNWTLRIQDFLDCDNEMHLYSWELILHGTVTSPLDSTPKDGMYGGYCDDATQCKNGTHCLRRFNVCVNCTIAGHRIVNNTCVEDGYGYCDVNVTCRVGNAWCNHDNICETCSEGYHEINGICQQDGTLGGYCDAVTVCTDDRAWCHPRSDTCYLCPVDSHILNGLCMKDGEPYGYCDTRIPCNRFLACEPNTNICIYCLWFQHVRIINGFCMKDGTIGGYCSSEIPCTDSGSSCNRETNTCILCTMDGYHSVDGYCMQDGMIGGYCGSGINCIDTGTGCGPQSQICINCSMPGYRILSDGYCRQDGLIGGYCDTNVSCVTISATCDAEINICETCYAGHSIVNGHCYKDELHESDIDWDIETIIGTSSAGFVIGVGINIMIFVVTMQRSNFAKIELDIKQN